MWVDVRTADDARDADVVAADLLGDSIAANLLMVCFAYQKGLIPLAADSIARAIELNGAAVKMNLAAFKLGRELAAGPAPVAGGGPRLAVDRSEVDFGDVRFETMVRAVFTLSNTGTGP